MTPFPKPRKRGLPYALDALISTERWLRDEALKLEAVFGYEMPTVRNLRARAHYLHSVLGAEEFGTEKEQDTNA